MINWFKNNYMIAIPMCLILVMYTLIMTSSFPEEHPKGVKNEIITSRFAVRQICVDNKLYLMANARGTSIVPVMDNQFKLQESCNF